MIRRVTLPVSTAIWVRPLRHLGEERIEHDDQPLLVHASLYHQGQTEPRDSEHARSA